MTSRLPTRSKSGSAPTTRSTTSRFSSNANRAARKRSAKLGQESRFADAGFPVHDDDLVEPCGELGDDARLEREHHPQLEQPDAARVEVGQPKRVKRLAQIEVGLARRD